MKYPGGKAGSGVAQLIINQMPPHVEYVEAFLGGGAVLRAKRPALVNVGVDLDPAAVARVASIVGDGGEVQLLVADAIAYLRGRRWWTESLVYCDPPYLMETRSSQRRMYRYELEAAGHVALCDVLCRLPCYVMVSGYESELYCRRLASWRVVRYRTMTRGGRMAEECLWCNFPEPTELHDYRYLGRDFRERERIRRKRARWVAVLARLPVLERRALVESVLTMGLGQGENR
jgi:DNA adenine methylase